jgi:integrase
MIRYLNSYLGNVPIQKITPILVEQMLVEHCKTVSVSSAERVYKTLNHILKDAYRKDVVQKNVCNKVDKPVAQAREMRFLTKDEIIRLVAAMEDYKKNYHRKFRSDIQTEIYAHAHVIAVRLALTSGMRRGEVLGLTWGCVDLEEEILLVKQQYTEGGVRKPKTSRGVRRICLDSATIKHLRGWKTAQAEYLQSLEIESMDDLPVITNLIGGYCEIRGFSRWWRMFRKLYGFEDLRFHDLRHTVASHLISAGTDLKTTQMRLGHSKASITLNVYGHLLPGKDREAAIFSGSLLETTKDRKNTAVI